MWKQGPAWPVNTAEPTDWRLTPKLLFLFKTILGGGGVAQSRKTELTLSTGRTFWNSRIWLDSLRPLLLPGNVSETTTRVTDRRRHQDAGSGS